MILAIPESPKFNYAKKRYGDVRASLQALARVNGVKNHQDVFKNTQFEVEFYEKKVQEKHSGQTDANDGDFRQVNEFLKQTKAKEIEL